MMDYHVRNPNTNRLYKIYECMKTRCYNHNRKNYDRYGGRGITVCDEWLNNYDAFCDWALSHGYNDKLSIDRINNDGNYEPDNCRWATNMEQARNKSNNIWIEKDGIRQTAKDWCNQLGISYTTFINRLRRGWDYERALNTPIKKQKGPIMLTYNGKTQSIFAWAKELNIDRGTLQHRITMFDWSVERALTEPIHNNGRK
jgi:hypothetical protein